MISKKPKVLIVDDEQVVCDILCDELSEQGYLCATALDGSAALAKLMTQCFEAVLLDIRLPDMSGMEVLAEIQSNHPNTPTIIITAVNDLDMVVKAMKLGALDYIVKPFSLDRINASIRIVLETEKHSAERRDYEKPLYVGGEEEDKQAFGEYSDEMNAIAQGVAARHDLLLGHSKMVIQETVDIARRLGIPEEEIQRWAVVRTRHVSDRNAAIASLLDKLERSPLAQSMMGVAVPYPYIIKPDESQN